jgi:hypothetical protein
MNRVGAKLGYLKIQDILKQEERLKAPRDQDGIQSSKKSKSQKLDSPDFHFGGSSFYR